LAQTTNITLDVGLTVGRKIAALAEAYAKPLAPHDWTGPVTLMAGLHLALHAPTAIFQEVVRATLATWYRDLVTALHPDIRRRPDATLRETGAS
jgi:L-alanine-DL-glutamate epimerase-like enolase superfamily enzyme